MRIKNPKSNNQIKKPVTVNEKIRLLKKEIKLLHLEIEKVKRALSAVTEQQQCCVHPDWYY